jgi:hypothetical protein
MGLLGYIARGSGFTPESPGMVNLEMVTSLFPAWVTAPFALMLVSGLLSTVDSNLCAMASLTSDITSSQSVAVPRCAMLVNLVMGIIIANVPGITITGLWLFYGTLRASAMAPTALTLAGKPLRWVTGGVLVSLVAGLSIFAWGNMADMSAVKVIGSLVTLCASGIISLIGGRHAERA